MTHPLEVEEAWQALAEAAGTPDQPSAETRAFLSWCEAGGYLVHITDDGITVDQRAPFDNETGQPSLDAAWRIEQVG